MSGATSNWTDIAFTAQDGLRLYGRHYPAVGGAARRRPVVCLPGLTRNSRDFHDVATAVSGAAEARDVYTLDSRGRGLSANDPTWQNYSVPVETRDALDFLTSRDVHGAAVIGTSRGGVLAMMMAAARPSSIGAAILNDVGPVIERNGLARIMAYVGRIPVPADWAEAGRMTYDMTREQFPTLTLEDAGALARQWFNDVGGKPVPAYDAAIAKSLVLPKGPMPALWKQFGALDHVPVLVLRGGTSDLLTDAAVAEMATRHPNLAHHTVPDEGHAPLLRDAPTQAVIQAFLQRTDAAPR